MSWQTSWTSVIACGWSPAAGPASTATKRSARWRKTETWSSRTRSTRQIRSKLLSPFENLQRCSNWVVRKDEDSSIWTHRYGSTFLFNDINSNWNCIYISFPVKPLATWRDVFILGLSGQETPTLMQKTRLFQLITLLPSW